jgi:hypothetical protein
MPKFYAQDIILKRRSYQWFATTIYNTSTDFESGVKARICRHYVNFFQGVFASVCRNEIAGKHHEMCQLARFLDNNRCLDLYSSVSELPLSKETYF